MSMNIKFPLDVKLNQLHESDKVYITLLNIRYLEVQLLSMQNSRNFAEPAILTSGTLCRILSNDDLQMISSHKYRDTGQVLRLSISRTENVTYKDQTNGRFYEIWSVLIIGSELDIRNHLIRERTYIKLNIRQDISVLDLTNGL